MPSTDPSSESPNNSPQENPDLKAGLKALKQKKYREAIALLEAIDWENIEGKSYFQAKMGLAFAYEKTQQLEKAIALCRELQNSRYPQVKTWANTTLQKLEKKRETQQKPAGFVAFDDSNTKPVIPQPGQGKVRGDRPTETELKEGKVRGENPTETEPETTETEPETSKPEILEGGEVTEKSTEKSTTYRPEIGQWRQAERATKARKLKHKKLTRFWFEMAATAIALFWLTRAILMVFMDKTNDFLVWLPRVRPIQPFYRDPTQNLVIALILLFVLSPWLIDWLLKLRYGLETLPRTDLLKRSQEAHKLVRNFSKKKNVPNLTLKVIPLAVPVAMTYGCWPRFARIVVSQGLLDSLDEDEIATIYARELGHIERWDFLVMSFATVLLQVPYSLYWLLAEGADRGAELVRRGFPDRVPQPAAKVLSYIIMGLRPLAAIISSLAYGLFWLMRWLVLWVSRRRVYYSDRFACDLTTNPNALTRALLKIALGMAAEIQEKGQTTTFLEGFDLLLPVGVKQGMSIGSVAKHASFESILQWDICNPYRQWLTVNNTHPLMGDRLQMLGFYAKFQKLETELDWEVSQATSWDRQKLLLLGAPFFGVPLGLAVALAFWLIGGIFYLLNWWQVDWLLGDFWLLVGCLPIGYSLGTIIRIDRFFPDLRPSKILDDPSLPELLSSPEALPSDSQPVRLHGKLLGRSGTLGLLGQDLIIETSTGLVKLHHFSKSGPFGNLWPKSSRPCDLVGKSVTATGWWRRGATPWLDIERLQAEGGKSIYSHHPIWSSIVAGACAVWGTYIIYRGGF